MAERVALEPAAGLVVSWDLADDLRHGEETPSPAFDGTLTPEYSALRVLTGTTSAGRTFLLAAARPATADAHDAEAVAATVLGPGDERRDIAETLLSTEYGRDGAVRRITLELELEGEDYPLRGAGDTESAESDERGEMHLETARLRFRLDGEPGVATYSILTV